MKRMSLKKAFPESYFVAFNEMNMGKNLSIETLRGVAILLMIVYHVIGSDFSGGMKAEYPSIWRYISDCCGYIIVPLYASISGWVYGLKSSSTQKPLQFIRNKFLRLVLPAFSVGTIYFIVQYLTPGTNVKPELFSIWKIYIYPYTIFWFLPSVFWAIILQYFIDKYNLCNSLKHFMILLLLSYGLKLIMDLGSLDSVPNLFSFKGTISIYPYILIGLAVSRFKSSIQNIFNNRVLITTPILLFVFINYLWFFNDGRDLWLISSATSTFLVGATILWIISCRFENDILAWIGGYSYGIYLFHAFGTAAGRILLTSFGVSNTLVIFIVSFAISLFGSLVAVAVIKKIKFANFLFLGAKFKI